MSIFHIRIPTTIYRIHVISAPSRREAVEILRVELERLKPDEIHYHWDEINDEDIEEINDEN